MMVHQADWVCPASGPPIRNGVITVKDGRIAAVGPAETKSGPENRRVYQGCALIPGFVNAHAHIELTLFKGLLEGLPFADWIARLVRMKYQLCTIDDFRLSAKLGAMEMLKGGITALGEVMDFGTGWDAMTECGLRGVAYQEVFGPSADSASESLQNLIKKLERFQDAEKPALRLGVSPHAPYTVSKSLFEYIRDFARREHLRITTHIAESKAEVAFVQDGTGPFADSHHRRGIPVSAYGCLPVAYLDGLGLLGPDMLLVHAIEADGHDLDRLGITGTCVVHCPRSNGKLQHGVADVAGMWKRGVTVALGTDSDASNDSIDMFGEMREAWRRQQMTFADVFQMATVHGARSLGLEDQIGTLEPGKLADFSVVALRDPNADPLENMVRFASRSDVRKTFLAGREAVLDFPDLEASVERIRSRLRAQL